MIEINQQLPEGRRPRECRCARRLAYGSFEELKVCRRIRGERKYARPAVDPGTLAWLQMEDKWLR